MAGISQASMPVELPASSKLSVEETIGFRETIKIGKWLPVTVTIRNDGAALRGLLALELSTVSEGYPQPYTTTLSQAVDLPTQSRKRYTFVVMFRGFTHPLVIRLTDQSGMSVYTREIDLRTLSSPDRLILVFSNEPALDSLANVAPGKARVVYQNLDELPDDGMPWMRSTSSPCATFPWRRCGPSRCRRCSNGWRAAVTRW